MSGDPHVIARNVRATRSTVEALAAHFGIELNEYGEPVETGPAILDQAGSSLVSGYRDANSGVAISGQTPALARATGALVELDGRLELLYPEHLDDETVGEVSATIVSAALHDPDDDVIARTLREHGIRGSSGTGREPWTSSCWAPGCDWRGDSSSHPAHQADAVRAAILGARGEVSAS